MEFVMKFVNLGLTQVSRASPDHVQLLIYLEHELL